MPDEPESARVADMLAARIREHRNRLGLSREELAERCGLGDGFVRDIENCVSKRSGPALFLVLKLAQGLGVTLDELLGGTQPVRLDGFGFLDQERVDRILAARSIGELDDLVEGGTLCFGALFNGADRLVPRDDWKEIEAHCIAHYASLAARERRRR